VGGGAVVVDVDVLHEEIVSVVTKPFLRRRLVVHFFFHAAAVPLLRIFFHHQLLHLHPLAVTAVDGELHVPRVVPLLPFHVVEERRGLPLPLFLGFLLVHLPRHPRQLALSRAVVPHPRSAFVGEERLRLRFVHPYRLLESLVGREAQEGH